MATTILGLDIGGANLKAATPDKRAISVPFPLWKQPDRLPAALAELVARFPDAEELAVTMTGELCDCFETKRNGVSAIIKAVRFASNGRRIRVWSTDGGFADPEEGVRDYWSIAAANWNALATFAGRYAPARGGLLLDIGSTTTDIIPLKDGRPAANGWNDQERLECCELVYVGVRRTPVVAVLNERTMAEFFATTQDAYVVLGMLPEEPENRDTADNRPLTRRHCLARLARMLGGDLDSLAENRIVGLATQVHSRVVQRLSDAVFTAYHQTLKPPPLTTIVVSGAGEFLARKVIETDLRLEGFEVVSLNEQLGPAVSACAPAYAVAVLAAEAR